MARIADDVDDYAAFPLAHGTVNLARHVHIAEELELPAIAYLSVVHPGDRALWDGAGVVHKDIHAGKLLRQAGGDFRLAEIARVAGHLDLGLGEDFLFRRLEIGGAAGSEVHVAAFCCKEARYRKTDSARGARNERSAPGKMKVHSVLSGLVRGSLRPAGAERRVF